MTHVVIPSYCALWANRMTSGVFRDMVQTCFHCVTHALCLPCLAHAQSAQAGPPTTSQDCMFTEFVC